MKKSLTFLLLPVAVFMFGLKMVHAETFGSDCKFVVTQPSEFMYHLELVNKNTNQKNALCRVVTFRVENYDKSTAKIKSMSEYSLDISLSNGDKFTVYVEKDGEAISQYFQYPLTATSTCQSPYVPYNGACVDPIPACKNPPANVLPSTCIDKIENGKYIERYSFSCADGYKKQNNECVNTCASPLVPYKGQCVDPIPACQNPPANVMPSTCIDKIEGGEKTERYSFSCLAGYKKEGKECVSEKCQSPYVEYQGACVDPIPACQSWPKYAVACVDKIENGQRISRYSFNCQEGYVRSGNECVSTINYKPEQTSDKTIPPAGFEDEIIVNPEAYKNPFPDTNVNYLEGKAAAELYRRGVIGGYPDGQFKGARDVNRAEAAKFLLLAKLGSVKDLKNTGRFPDVVDGQWYVSFVINAANLGIIDGYPDGNFRPQNTVNTAEFLKMLTKTFGLEENLPYTFTDVKSSDWFSKYAGVVNKYDLLPNRGSKLDPAKNMTRSEVSVAIYRYLQNRMSKNDDVAN